MMFRITLPRDLCVFALVGLMGCTHLVESHAIHQFTDALEEQNYENLRSATSKKFEERALKTAEALDDFKILNLPKGETSVVEVQDTSETEKLVTVSAGKLKRKLFYRLIKDPGTEEWVVDDVYIRQRKGGVKVDKSVTEQMDLLQGVREFLTVWDSGTREEVLGVATPDLAAVLGQLPPMQLSRLCRSVVSEHVDDKRHHPQAQLDNDVAVVTLPRKTGKMILSYKLMDGEWRVSDIAVESKKDHEHIPSVLKTATVMRAGIQFLEAYNAGDKPRLKGVCHPKFYEGSILPGDLSLVSLPSQFLTTGQYHIKMQGNQADFVIDDGTQVVRIGLNRDLSDDPLDKKTVYLIDDVTVYDTSKPEDELQEMRLSMVFTGRAVLQLFRESLAEGNLPLLRKTVTQDFSRRVWQRIEDDALVEFTPRIMTNHIENTLKAEYDGAICKITVTQMGQPVTYILRDHSGQVAVDDVLIDHSDELASMKETLEVLIPVRRFREALANSDLGTLQRSSSSDLNRMIWKQADDVPAAGRIAVKHLQAPLKKVEHMEEGKTLVQFGNDAFGCSVLLVTEHDQQVVDDIVLVAGLQPELRARLKRKMREQIAFGAPEPDPKSQVLPAGHWEHPPQQKRHAVSQAGFQEIEPLPEDASPVPLPSANLQRVQKAMREAEPVPHPPLPPQTPPGQVAPPLFPNGEADLERVPEIKPEEVHSIRRSI